MRSVTLESAIAAAGDGLEGPGAGELLPAFAVYLRDAIHPFRQQKNGMLVQSTCNSTQQPKVRTHLEE